MPSTQRRLSAVVFCMIAWAGVAAIDNACNAAESPTPADRPAGERRVILVTLDGVRWEDVFNGFDPRLNLLQAGGVQKPAELARRFRRDTPQESRAELMPFFWQVVAAGGQVYGDRSLKNVGQVTNPYRFSYPGYSEMLCGHVDRGIDSNKPRPNPNVTVLEWLNGRPGFKGQVAAYGAWDCIAAIVNKERCGFHVAAGWDPIPEYGGVPLTEREKTINDLLARSTRLWAEEPPDALVAEAAAEHLKKHKPKVLYVSLGEPDEWAHARRYDLYLDSIQRCDAIIRRLWETAQSMPEYAGRTSLLITTDHGRGSGPRDWTDHGEKVEGADGWWAAVIGPGIPATGPRGEETVQQCQVAATVAALAGEDYPAAEPRAAKPLPTEKR